MSGPARPPKPEAIQSTTYITGEEVKAQRQVPSRESDPPEFDLDFLKDLSVQDLHALLADSALLDAIYESQHPQAGQLAQIVSKQEREEKDARDRVTALRQEAFEKKLECEQSLIETKELEKEWEEVERNMYASLKPFSSSALFSELKSATTESEKLSESLEASFINQNSANQNEGVQDFIKEYRSARKLYHLRNERLARWKEGRVGGFR